MSLQGELLAMLETVAEALGEHLCRQMVFVGGCSTAVLITDEITLQEIRATDDVDLIVGLKGMVEWLKLQDNLSEKGFTVSGDDEVVCRMRLGNLKIDFMPDDPDILGFSNRWYKDGIYTAVRYRLPSGRAIRHLTPALFLATKLEAYGERGNSDPLGSHDLEDIINVIDGRPALLEEVSRSPADVRAYLSEKFRALLGHPDYESGKSKRSRRIFGGRERLRKSLYAAALPAAFQWNDALIALYQRLVAAGKPHKIAMIACARKLLIFANTVVKRDQPWIAKNRPC